MRQRINVRRARVPPRSQRIPPSPPSPLCDPPFHISAAPTPSDVETTYRRPPSEEPPSATPSFSSTTQHVACALGADITVLAFAIVADVGHARLCYSQRFSAFGKGIVRFLYTVLFVCCCVLSR
ncbi:hypothetical protein K523DRAFT_422470 [Schizophyllum commune Tattone D]|nr:hypothetical protein K523DRAFT_422470 [Schizophyllum commune Tattone D]